MSSDDLNTDLKRALRVIREQKRHYDESEEATRRIHYQNLEIKDQHYYNRTQSLWNEPRKLHPTKYARYSEKNVDLDTTFKKTVRDLPKIAQDERNQSFRAKLNAIARNRNADKERILTRQLERQIWQFKASQHIPESTQQFLHGLAEDDPH